MIVCLILPISSNKNFEFFFKKITSIGQKIKFESQYRHNKAYYGFWYEILNLFPNLFIELLA